ncbi:MAG: hypothetical protein M3349_01605, partial [Actinomycetota bacterium]|nr:hypothetical protein [Actinomycetota bacterium]
VMATHDHAIVDAMRRRVVQLERGRIVRDQAGGLYDRRGAGPAQQPARTQGDIEVPLADPTEITAEIPAINRPITTRPRPETIEPVDAGPETIELEAVEVGTAEFSDAEDAR